MKTKSQLQSILPVVLLLGTAASPAVADWDQFQGDAGHTGYVAGKVDGASPRLLWQIETTPYSLGEESDVAIVDGDVFVTKRAGYSLSGPFTLNRLDGGNGKQVWQQTISANSYSGVSAPTVSGDTVYVHRWGHSGSSGSTYPDDYPALLGFDIDTGAPSFATTHAGQWSSGSRPTVEGNQVFAAGGYYGGLDAYALDGTPQWFTKVNQQYGWIPAADANNAYVYMGSASASPGPSIGTLYVVDRNTGQSSTILHPSSGSTLYGELQSVMLGGRGDALALTYNNVFGQDNKTLVSFDIAAGDIAWEITGEFSGNAAVGNGMIAIPDGDVLRFIDQDTGVDLWNWFGGEVFGNVVLTDNFAFVNALDSVHAIDLKSRTSVWSFGQNGDLALSDGLLIISNPSGVSAFAVPVVGSGLLVLPAWLLLSLRRRLRGNTGRA